MHRIGRVIVKNFRTCQSVDLVLSDLTPLVGQNNAGKTTILKAIKLLLSADAKADGDDRWDNTQPIELVGKIEGITPAVLAAMADEDHRTAIAPYVVDETLWLRSQTSPDLKWKRTVWTPADGVNGDGVPNTFRDLPTGIQAPLRVLFPEVVHIEAMKNLEDDIAKAKAKGTMRELLDMLAGQVMSERAEIQEALDRVHALLITTGSASGTTSRQSFDDDASAMLGMFFPGYGIETRFAPVKAEDFFKNAAVSVTEPFGPSRDFDEVGAGTQRGIQMALVQMLGQRRTTAGSAQRMLLLIDEPELYMHPQAIRRIRQNLKVLSTQGYQVIFTTHSPEMLTRETAQQTVIVRREPGTGTVAKKPVATLVKALQARGAADALFSLNVMADTFFSLLIVLTEGESDARLLRAAYEVLFGLSPDTDGVAFVPVGASQKIRPAQEILRDLGLVAIGVADLDYLFKHINDHRRHMTISSADEAAVKDHVASIVGSVGCQLGGDGWPQGGPTGGKAEQAWGALAQHAPASTLLNALCRAAEPSGVAFWREGSVEHAFGIAKHESAYTAAIASWTDAASFRAASPSVAARLDWIRAQLPSAPLTT